MTDYGRLYNKAFEKITPEWLADLKKVEKYLEKNRHTLVEYYNSYSSQFNFPDKNYEDLRVLDLGCGLGGVSFFFAQKGAQTVGLDASRLAVAAAKELARQKGLSSAEFVSLDITKVDLDLGKFDLIIDSHLLHCLITNEDRARYYQNITQALAPDGLFLLETMVFQKNFRSPIDYALDEEFTLWKREKGVETPIRKVLPGIDLENEIKNAGLSIHYLYFHAELAFEVFDDYANYPHQNLPQTARLGAKLARS